MTRDERRRKAPASQLLTLRTGCGPFRPYCASAMKALEIPVTTMRFSRSCTRQLYLYLSIFSPTLGRLFKTTLFLFRLTGGNRSLLFIHWILWDAIRMNFLLPGNEFVQ